MYLSTLLIENFRCFGEGDSRFEMHLNQGVTALVGENEAGKTAVIDAIRLVLGTSDQERVWLEDTDYYNEDATREIRVSCVLEGLTADDKKSFVEHLTYDADGGSEPVFNIYWTAKNTGVLRRGRVQRQVECRSGKSGSGPTLDSDVRDLLQTTYLRPLRDAEQAMASGRGSRLSQILQQREKITDAGESYDPEMTPMQDPSKLSVLGIGDLANHLLGKQEGVIEARTRINTHLESLTLTGDGTQATIKVSGIKNPDQTRLRQLLEKLQLDIDLIGNPGLGSSNLLFMACELLLLSEDESGLKLLLIEEPEAHLHPQRQLQVMKFLQETARSKDIQVILTTHSPNLASAIRLNDLVMIRKARAFSMAIGETMLNTSDYGFLERFLDVTKANLFFARGVMIVEGDAENILLPSLARLVDRDFTKHGVSIVNVGGVGLSRYAKIFQRADTTEDVEIDIPVACVTDMDVMPNCAPVIIGKVKEGETWPEGRRWRSKSDLGDTIAARRQEINDRASGQRVKTFVSDEWTLEYDLALGPKDLDGKFSGGLAEEVYVAACLADNDDAINKGTKQTEQVQADAKVAFSVITASAQAADDYTIDEVVASHVYAKFAKDNVSKTVAAQYLATRLEAMEENDPGTLRTRLPNYLIEAIDYVTDQGTSSKEG